MAAARDAHLADGPWGRWYVLNPDRGELLDGGQKLIVAGSYQFWPSGTAVAELHFRDAAGEVSVERWTGTAHVGPDDTLSVDLNAGGRETFVAEASDVMRRSSRTQPSAEAECVIRRVAPYPPPDGSRPGRLPSVFFNTMPKSGSVFLTHWIVQLTGLASTFVGPSYFPEGLVLRDLFDKFAEGGCFCQHHLPASDVNLRIIGNRMKNIVVHIRDPRSAVLSWLHHLDRYHERRFVAPGYWSGLEEVISPDSDYFARSFEAKLDQLIEQHIPVLVKWTSDWLTAAETRRHGLNVLFTKYGELIEDPRGLIARILRHSGIDPAWMDIAKEPEKATALHFRRGDPREWEQVFSAKQRETANALIPANLASRFGWTL